jgi:hypothetical protein
LSNVPVKQEYEQQYRDGHAKWRFPQRGEHTAGGDCKQYQDSYEVPGEAPQAFGHQARDTEQVVEVVKVKQ